MMRTTKNLIYYDLLWHCPVSSKMAYKMNLAGQQICCPFTLRWQLYDKRIADLIKEKGFTRLEADPSIPDVIHSEPESKFDYHVIRDGKIYAYADCPLEPEMGRERFEYHLVQLASYLPLQMRRRMLVKI